MSMTGTSNDDEEPIPFADGGWFRDGLTDFIKDTLLQLFLLCCERSLERQRTTNRSERALRKRNSGQDLLAEIAAVHVHGAQLPDPFMPAEGRLGDGVEDLPGVADDSPDAPTLA